MNSIEVRNEDERTACDALLSLMRQYGGTDFHGGVGVELKYQAGRVRQIRDTHERTHKPLSPQ